MTAGLPLYLSIGLGGREIARETDIEKAVVDDQIERNVEGDRGAGLEHAVARHVLLGDPIGIGAAFRLVGKMHPAEFLERRLERGIVAIAVDRALRRPALGNSEAS